MTFLAAQAIRQLDRPEALPTLSQRGRASIQFLGAAQRYSSATLRPLARRDFAADADSAAVVAEAARTAGVAGKPKWLASMAVMEELLRRKGVTSPEALDARLEALRAELHRNAETVETLVARGRAARERNRGA